MIQDAQLQDSRPFSIECCVSKFVEPETATETLRRYKAAGSDQIP